MVQNMQNIEKLVKKAPRSDVLTLVDSDNIKE